MTLTKRFTGLVAALAVAMAFAPVMSALAMSNAIGAVEVSVRTYGGQTALQNVAVQLVDVETAEVVATATTDAEGNAAFGELPLGLYQLRASLEGYADMASPLMPLAESMPTSNVVLELQDQDDDDDEAAAAAAGGFTFLGLSGGGAIAALIGVVAAAGLATYGIVQATQDDSP